MDLGDVDADLAGKGAVFSDADDAAVHRRFDAAFDDQRVAVEDFSALELDVGADDQARAHHVAAGRGGFAHGLDSGRRRLGADGRNRLLDRGNAPG